MNSVGLFVEQAQRNPNRMALWVPGNQPLTFQELLQHSGGAQSHLKKKGLAEKDFVLVMDPLSPRLYALIIACLARGACVLFVEPWMRADKISRLIAETRPKFFIAGWRGRLWGARLPEIRRIPNWIWPDQAFHDRGSLLLEDVSDEILGILTFTSGTTGLPKGVQRSHGFMRAQHRVLNRTLELETHSQPDLCIFANFALANLASGRGSILVPTTWKKRHLRQIQSLPPLLQPSTLTTGPAFLQHLIESGGLPSLKSIHVGGALTDNHLFESGFQHWPKAHWSHLYGSSEAEPVASVDAQEAVTISKDRGYFQTLYLGHPVSELQVRIEPNDLWISGDHVGPEYWGGDTPENRTNKQRLQGQLWHRMGDRIHADEKGWWYQGRSHLDAGLFLLEQQVYNRLGHSRAFLQPTPQGNWLFGEDLQENLYKDFDLQGQTMVPIIRDPRHRARIDRETSLRKGAPWALG